MRCPLVWDAIVSLAGEVRRPEQPCPHEVEHLEGDVWSCPMHGRVTIEDGLAEQAWEQIDTVLSRNGHRPNLLRRMLRRG